LGAEAMTETNIKDAQEVDFLVQKEWRRAKLVAKGWALIGVFLIIFVWGITNRPILELNQMQVNEGVLVEVYPDGRRTLGKLVLKQDDGSLFSVIPYQGTEGFEERVGARFKVWSEEYCYVLNFLCTQQMTQLQYRGQIVLDYEKTARPNKEAFRDGNVKYLFYGFPLFFFLVAIGTLEGISRKIKKIRTEFKRKGSEPFNW